MFSDMYKVYISFFQEKKMWKIFTYKELSSYKPLNHLFVPYAHYKNFLKLLKNNLFELF